MKADEKQIPEVIRVKMKAGMRRFWDSQRKIRLENTSLRNENAALKEENRLLKQTLGAMKNARIRKQRTG